MKMNISNIGLLFTVMLYGLTAKGQDVTVKVDYPSMVRVGQQFSVMWTVNTGGGEFSAPSFDGFYRIAGPQTSFSSSTQIINNKVTRETSYTYVYYLQALTEGRYVIGPASFTLKNRTYRSDSIRIEVVNDTPGAQTQTQTQTQQQAGTGTKPAQVQSGGEDIFVRLILNRNEILMGEHILASVKIYTRIDISGISEIKFPSFDGFLKTDLETPPLTSLERENVDGVIYGTGVVQQFLLYPQVTGEIIIEPVQLTALMRQKAGRTDPFFGDVFGDFFSTYQTVHRAVISPGMKVRVKPLPGVRPADFSGFVGQLKINAVINRDSVTVNDAVNLKITISGSGNLRLATAPELNLPPDIEVYDPKVADEIRNSSAGTTGQRTFEYLLIPRHHGDFSIPPVSYSYFNTSTGSYERLTTDGMKFHAQRAPEGATGITIYGGVAKEDVRYLGRDIRFIRSEPDRIDRTESLFISKSSFYTLYGFAAVVFLAILFIRREHVKRNADINAVRNRKAARIAAKRLKEASHCLKTGQTDRFHEEILKALWGYLSDKLNIPLSLLTRSNAFDNLKEKGVTEDVINNLGDILDKCEYARYAPASSEAAAVEIYDRASEFIRQIENLKG